MPTKVKNILKLSAKELATTVDQKIIDGLTTSAQVAQKQTLRNGFPSDPNSLAALQTWINNFGSLLMRANTTPGAPAVLAQMMGINPQKLPLLISNLQTETNTINTFVQNSKRMRGNLPGIKNPQGN